MARPRSETKLPLPVIAFLVAIVMPHTIAFYAGSLLISPIRIVMLVLAIPILGRLAQSRARLALSDAAVALFCAWTAICILVNYPEGQNIERAGQVLLETMLSFFLARLYLTKFSEIRTLLKYLLYITIAAFILAIPEAVFHKKFILDTTSAITGIPIRMLEDSEGGARMGLLRPNVVFEHPILYGVFCCTLTCFAWYGEPDRKKRFWMVALIGAAVFLSLSSGPILMFVLQIFLMAVEYYTRNIKNRIAIITIAIGLLIFALQMFSKSGAISIVVRYLTFNQGSAYYRTLIWEYGVQNMQQYPIFGRVVEEWERASWMGLSIDNFWIFNGIQSGFVGLGLLVVAIALVFRRLNRIPLRWLAKDEIGFRRSWTIMMLALLLTGFSVMFFGLLQPYFYFLLGLGGAAAAILERTVASRRSEMSRSSGQRDRSHAPA